MEAVDHTQWGCYIQADRWVGHSIQLVETVDAAVAETDYLQPIRA